ALPRATFGRRIAPWRQSTRSCREPQRHDQARIRVAEFDRAAVQPDNRSYEAEAEPASGQRAAQLEPDEALQHVAAFRFRNAGAVVAYLEDGIAAVAPGRDDNAEWCACNVPERRMLDGIVDKVGERLAEKLAAAFERKRLRGVDRKRNPLLVGQRLIQLGHVATDAAEVDIGHRRVGQPRLHTRDHQQRVKIWMSRSDSPWSTRARPC